MPEIKLKSPDELSADLHELRRGILSLGKTLRRFGKSGLEGVGEEFEDLSEDVLHQGRSTLHAMERRVGQLEKTVERNLREHPAAWAGAMLGLIGFGLVVGRILRDRR